MTDAKARPPAAADATGPEPVVVPERGDGEASAAPPGDAELGGESAPDARQPPTPDAVSPPAGVPLGGTAPVAEPTVGTGSVFAIGCAAATLVFVVIAIAVAAWLR